MTWYKYRCKFTTSKANMLSQTKSGCVIIAAQIKQPTKKAYTMKNSNYPVTLKLDRDTNGNKIVKITRSGFTGFSIQTLGNLPRTHRRPMKERLTDYDYLVITIEIQDYLLKYGTDKQKSITAGF